MAQKNQNKTKPTFFSLLFTLGKFFWLVHKFIYSLLCYFQSIVETIQLFLCLVLFKFPLVSSLYPQFLCWDFLAFYILRTFALTFWSTIIIVALESLYQIILICTSSWHWHLLFVSCHARLRYSWPGYLYVDYFQIVSCTFWIWDCGYLF